MKVQEIIDLYLQGKLSEAEIRAFKEECDALPEEERLRVIGEFDKIIADFNAKANTCNKIADSMSCFGGLMIGIGIVVLYLVLR